MSENKTAENTKNQQSDNILEVSHLKKYFPIKGGMFGKQVGAVKAVDDVSFTLKRGTTMGLVGESGCGKSTTGRTILRLIEKTDGQVLFNGKDVYGLSNKEMRDMRTKMQIIFQDPYASLNPRMSIGDIIAEPLKIYKLCNSKEEQQKKVREIMDVVGLAERTYGLYPHELDGGRRQRVGIARALILDPKLVVCDEPVSALDVSIQAQILNLMMELQKERNLTYLFITHNLSVVKHISDDITVMYLGQMVEKAGSAEIFAHQYHPYTKALISAIPLPKYNAPDNQIILKGEITSPINVTKSCRFAPRCVYAKPECFENEPQLEEIEKDHFVKCHFVREINGL